MTPTAAPTRARAQETLALVRSVHLRRQAGKKPPVGAGSAAAAARAAGQAGAGGGHKTERRPWRFANTEEQTPSTERFELCASCSKWHLFDRDLAKLTAFRYIGRGCGTVLTSGRGMEPARALSPESRAAAAAPSPNSSMETPAMPSTAENPNPPASLETKLEAILAEALISLMAQDTGFRSRIRSMIDQADERVALQDKAWRQLQAKKKPGRVKWPKVTFPKDFVCPRRPRHRGRHGAACLKAAGLA